MVRGRKSDFPTKPLCPVCREAKVLESHTFIVVSGGAYLMDRKKDWGGPSDKVDGYLYLTWHGAHDGGERPYRERGYSLRIADGVRGGQFDIYVCSPKCLRKMFREWIRQLEAGMRFRTMVQRPSKQTAAGAPCSKSLKATPRLALQRHPAQRC